MCSSSIDYSYNNENSFLTTVRNTAFEKKHPTLLHSIETEEDCILFCKQIEKYISAEGQLFTEKYSHLPNILNEMDKLESQGKYWKEILIGPNVLWKGLIISKLCNDSGFKNKINFVDNFYKEDVYEQKNISNYEKLKKIY